MINDDTTPLFEPDPNLPPQASMRQGIVQSWNTATGENTVQLAGGVLANVQALTSESANLVAGDVVVVLVTPAQCLVLGKVTTPGNPGTVPSWNGDILALQTDVVTAQTTANTGVSNAAAAQSTANTGVTNAAAAQSAANAAQADATNALSKFPITSTDISDGAISTPKLSANAIDGMTITGATIRTAASGRRILIDSIDQNEIKFFSGVSGEVSPGIIEASNPSAGVGRLWLVSPAFGGGTSQLLLENYNDGVTPDLAKLASSVISLNATGGITLTAASIDLDADDAFGSTVRANGAKVMVVGGNPQPVFVTDTTSLAVTLSQTYAAGSTVVGTAFTAPPSGSVYITVGGRIRLETNNQAMYLSFEVRTGGAVGSGTVQTAADNNRALVAGANTTGLTNIFAGGSFRWLITGLTPGAQYNVRTMHACQAVGSPAGTLFARNLLVEPVL